MVTKAEGVSCSRRREGTDMKGHGGGWQDGRLRQRVEQVCVSPQSAYQCDQDQYKVIRLHITETKPLIN